MKAWLAIILMAMSLGVAAESMYRWVDKDGKVHYSDKPPAAGEAAKVETRRSATLGMPQPEPSALMRQAMNDYPVTLYTQTDLRRTLRFGARFSQAPGHPLQREGPRHPGDADALRTVVGGTTS